MKSTSLNRRTFLKGILAGATVSIGLPPLEALPKSLSSASPVEAFRGGGGPGRIKSNLRQPPDALRFGLQGFVERVPLPPVLRRGALAGDAGPLGRVVAGAAPRRCVVGWRAALHLSVTFWSLCPTQINRSDANLPCRGLSVDECDCGGAAPPVVCSQIAAMRIWLRVCACRGFSV